MCNISLLLICKNGCIYFYWRRSLAWKDLSLSVCRLACVWTEHSRFLLYKTIHPIIFPDFYPALNYDVRILFVEIYKFSKYFLALWDKSLGIWMNFQIFLVLWLLHLERLNNSKNMKWFILTRNCYQSIWSCLFRKALREWSLSIYKIL